MKSIPAADTSLGEHFGRAAATALEEDLGCRDPDADVTTTATVPAGLHGDCVVVAKASGVVCGLDAIEATYGLLDARVGVRTQVRDGAEVSPGDVVAAASGPVRVLLTGERALLNVLTHLSGIATLTRAFVTAAPGVVITETRKTLPGLRALEKYAVRVGGGVNHRFSLWEGVLVKDNHVVAAGGVAEATRRARAATALPVQVECKDLTEVDQAVVAGADRILLDNMDIDTMRACVVRIRAMRNDVSIEATGGVTLENVPQIAATGVDRISIGALTHSAPILDLSVELVSTWT